MRKLAILLAAGLLLLSGGSAIAQDPEGTAEDAGNEAESIASGAQDDATGAPGDASAGLEGAGDAATRVVGDTGAIGAVGDLTGVADGTCLGGDVDPADETRLERCAADAERQATSREIPAACRDLLNEADAPNPDDAKALAERCGSDASAAAARAAESAPGLPGPGSAALQEARAMRLFALELSDLAKDYYEEIRLARQEVHADFVAAIHLKHGQYVEKVQALKADWKASVSEAKLACEEHLGTAGDGDSDPYVDCMESRLAAKRDELRDEMTAHVQEARLDIRLEKASARSAFVARVSELRLDFKEDLRALLAEYDAKIESATGERLLRAWVARAEGMFENVQARAEASADGASIRAGDASASTNPYGGRAGAAGADAHADVEGATLTDPEGNARSTRGVLP